jgi:hypothetical protein
MNTVVNFKVGDKCQYNKKYSQNEVVEILQTNSTHCLILFPSGIKICTKLSGLYPLQNVK